jgi:predicted MFS family arabinose efflux permease
VVNRNSVLLWLTVACCLSVSVLYFMQPLLSLIGKDFGVSASQMSLTVTLTQVGYALAMLLIVPLGDMFEKRRMVVISCVTSAASMILVGRSPTPIALMIASFLLGISTATPQLLVPMAANIAPPERRGRAVGTVLGGLFIGILGGRIVSGFLSESIGWRNVYFGMASVILVLAVVLRKVLPLVPAMLEDRNYGRLMASVLTIAKTEWRLRYSCIFGALSFAAFSLFWTTLSFHLSAPYLQLGPKVVGMFGFIGFIGVLVAPLTGKFADQGKEHVGNSLGLGLLALSFGLLAVFGFSIPGLILGVLILDFAASFNHISNQARNYSLRPDATSRVNTIYMTSYFIGGALGSWSGGLAWTYFGWYGVCGLGATLTVIGFVITLPYLKMKPV